MKSFHARRLPGRISQHRQAVRHDRFGQSQHTPQPIHATLARIHAGPHRAQAQRVRRQQHILHRRRAIDNPVAGRFLQFQIAANQNGQRRLARHLRVRVDLANLRQHRPIVDHHEMPGLSVPRARRAHACRQELLHQLLRHRSVLVLANAAPSVNGCQSFHVTPPCQVRP
jgi:hypothetical protein